MMKIINIRNLVILIVILAVIHFGVGMVVSPMVSSLVVEKINQYSGLRLSIEKAALWPLTLSCSLKSLKVFNPEKPDQRIAMVQDASVYISPWGLLSKRLVVSSFLMNRFELNLEGEPDGTFNIQKLSRPKEVGNKSEGSVVTAIGEKKDMFGKAYGLLKGALSKDTLQKQKIKRDEARKVTTEVAALPKGRRVFFKAASDRYLLEIKNLAINNAHLFIKSEEGKQFEVANARIVLGDFGFDPQNGSRINRMNLSGSVKTNGQDTGGLEISYDKVFRGDNQEVSFNLTLKDIDISALGFIYEKSLPVEIAKGILNLHSETTFLNDAINSNNTLSLSGHELRPKSQVEDSGKFMSIPTICETLNGIDPINLSFEITGTVDKPEFRGFQKSLMALVGSNLKAIQKTFENKAMQALDKYLKKQSEKAQKENPPSENQTQTDTSGKTNIQDVANSLQSLFGGKKEEPAQQK